MALKDSFRSLNNLVYAFVVIHQVRLVPNKCIMQGEPVVSKDNSTNKNMLIHTCRMFTDTFYQAIEEVSADRAI
jgi:hypothetical protein